jgi:hypothetical protein
MQLQEQLRNSIVEITFDKVDGTRRVMKCTQDPLYIDAHFAKSEKKTERTRESKEGLLIVFDTEKNDWRSIRTESIISWS